MFYAASSLGTLLLFWYPIIAPIESHGGGIWKYPLALIAGGFYIAFAGGIATVEYGNLPVAQKGPLRTAQFFFFAFILATALTGAFGHFV